MAESSGFSELYRNKIGMKKIAMLLGLSYHGAIEDNTDKAGVKRKHLLLAMN